ncbi:arsenate reductase [Clostridium tetanomorphum]|uniref:Arsenate reductase family protein n=1 Tax=Clostridium tetanomorphum TaxID=1553 RepID=A0A923E7B5_CLOTT|nr:arsenate reductase family protein [Clostridium tetanomorphum]KAJ51275.1 arsenate reductase [Clostridium tetanomorphum DSM 665]MBC2397862.1 arsenate reductase family protein [Clostridium tetanomorphum]MBP1864823.1 arsenate reductase [Clostridium tetanomorphum]NRS83999.1 arsenate reductase [Clostridium tetanomorphum]NRZ97217.1 arsenate reductase [Clostridium tetanomorphum]
MKYLFLQYPKCTTCKRAKKWLEDNKISFEDRHIVEDNPTEEEMKQWIKRSGFKINKFFNTSGVLYRQMNLKDKIKTASEQELINILSSNGMLVKRPLVIGEDFVLVGFKEEEWEKKLLNVDIK